MRLLKGGLVEASFTFEASQANLGNYTCIANKTVSKLSISIERASKYKELPTEWSEWTKWYDYLQLSITILHVITKKLY
jgi:hypothetical protein